jgi:hypothetical protein
MSDDLVWLLDYLRKGRLGVATPTIMGQAANAITAMQDELSQLRLALAAQVRETERLAAPAWQPPLEADRPDGYKCLVTVEMEWTRWEHPDGSFRRGNWQGEYREFSDDEVYAFAPLPDAQEEM